MTVSKNRVEITGVVKAIRESELDVCVSRVDGRGEVIESLFTVEGIYRMPPYLTVDSVVWVLGRLLGGGKIQAFRLLKVDSDASITPELFYPEKFSDEAIKTVVRTICDMYRNNVIEDNGSESFVGWCEDGDVFFKEEYADVMYELSPFVDRLTEKIESIWNHTEE